MNKALFCYNWLKGGKKDLEEGFVCQAQPVIDLPDAVLLCILQSEILKPVALSKSPESIAHWHDIRCFGAWYPLTPRVSFIQRIKSTRSFFTFISFWQHDRRERRLKATAVPLTITFRPLIAAHAMLSASNSSFESIQWHFVDCHTDSSEIRLEYKRRSYIWEDISRKPYCSPSFLPTYLS